MIVAENSKWELRKCQRCGHEEYFEKIEGGYQPKPVYQDKILMQNPKGKKQEPADT